MTPVERILAKVQAKKQGKGWEAKCPAHDDRKASLCIAESGNGDALVFCQAGCKTEAVLACIGLKLNDLFSTPLERQQPVYWVYTDRNGQPEFRKGRTPEKKWFIDRLEDSQWVSGKNGKTPDLYNIVEVVKALKDKKTVWVVEGEKDTEAMRRHGQVATTNWNGAGKGYDQYFDLLDGANVAVIADRDKPGYQHALKIYETLAPGSKVKMFIAKAGKDAADHFTFGYSVKDFVPVTETDLRLGLKTGLDAYETPFVLEGVKSDLERPRQRWVTMAEVEAKPVEWLWRPYLPLGEVTICGGMPGVGKSTVMQQVATAVSLGANINGVQVAKGHVVFMSAEQGLRTVTRPRFDQMGADLTAITCPDEEGEDGQVHPFALDSAGVLELREIVRANQTKLVVIDTCVKYFESQRDMNSAVQVREWMNRLINLARTCNCAVVMTAHLNKASGMDPLHRIAGSGDFGASVRSALLCGTDPDDKSRCGMAHIKANVGPKGPTLGYAIEDRGHDIGWFGWTETDLTAERMCEQPQTSEARATREGCVEWLRDALSKGPVLSKTLEAMAKSEGYGRRALDAAKKTVGAKPNKDGIDGAWYWLIPEDVQPEVYRGSTD